MGYNEDSYLMLSGIQHFAFCRRQWALIHIDGVWSENERTAEGRILHDNAHDIYRSESRGDVILSRAMPIFSRTLGLSGECDIVEFRKTSKQGITLNGREGLFTVYPVEYKRGSPKEDLCDILQMTAQAMCLEEMMCCTIHEGALYYFETKHRVKVSITDELRDTVRKYASEMHEYFDRQYLPRPKRTKACNACSLKEECLPKLEKIRSAKIYNDENLGGIWVMKKLQNTLYVTTPDAYLSLDGENIVLSVNKEERGRKPLHLFESIVVFGYSGVSPALLGKCAECGIIITFLTPSGKFLSRSVGKTYGNVIIRRTQYRIADDPKRSLHIAANMLSAKMTNSVAVLRRALSDHRERVNAEKVEYVAANIKLNSAKAYSAESAESLRGLEGECANQYFSVFDEMILAQKDTFKYDGRNRRPPLDPVNAMLSFGYALMTSMCTSALESAGLDPYVGFFHTDRSGRCSLALDLLEEFRAPFVDRFVLTMINKKAVSESSFCIKESGAVLLTDEARAEFLKQWQKKKNEEMIHPFLKEKVQWGMIPFVQAMLLAKYLRGDIDDYPPFIWK